MERPRDAGRFDGEHRLRLGDVLVLMAPDDPGKNPIALFP
jgi:hypothetical protein